MFLMIPMIVQRQSHQEMERKGECVTNYMNEYTIFTKLIFRTKIDTIWGG